MSFDSHDGHTNYDKEAEHKARHSEHHTVHHNVLEATTDLPHITQEVIKHASIELHKKPHIGDDVHYILSSGYYKGEHRPAKVVKIWSDTCVQLQVFTDALNDFHEGPGSNGLLWATSVTIDATREREGSFHWPED